MKQALLNNIKNIYGWKTKRKIVVFSVDDYGNVRLDSKKARKNMDKAGLKVLSRFDVYDTLETKEDLEMLLEALTSVKDKNDKPAIFTPFAMPCNIDFEIMAAEGNEKYTYELLPATYEKLSIRDTQAYEGAWQLWQEGIDKGLLRPQFHGREHLNLKVFEEKLQQKDHEVLTALANRSYTSISNSGYPTISITAAFEFSKMQENDRFQEIIVDGLNQFEKVYGYRSTHFNPPGGREHPVIHQYLKDSGVKYLDTPLVKQEHQGEGKYKRSLNYTGKKNHLGMTYQVRNVVFEPTHNRGFHWVDYAFKQVETAFFWNRPTIISSHRVNFCGHIDPKNRETGILALKELLQKIVTKWPEVEFLSSEALGDLMIKDKG
jgi:hypothetical protein